MRKLVLLIVAITLPFTFGFTLNLQPVTQHTDGTPITVLPVMYDAWVDDAPLATGTTLTKIPLADNTFGATHVYKVRTRLTDGRVSETKAETLTSPADVRPPKTPSCSIGN